MEMNIEYIQQAQSFVELRGNITFWTWQVLRIIKFKKYFITVDRGAGNNFSFHFFKLLKFSLVEYVLVFARDIWIGL